MKGGILPFSSKTNTFSRNDLATLFYELGYKLGAEVGVYKGENAKVLLDANPNLHLICVDPWLGELKQSRYDSAMGRLVGRDIEVKRMLSVDAAKEVKDGSLDFVYIDASHLFDDIMIDLITWNRKVRIGGIVSGHDYFHISKIGVVEAVNAYTYAHSITQWYITNDIHPSWFWVRK
jgi:predicted O-methyltransferase YrrM